MNRWDEIQGVARDIASNVHADPALRDAMADDLIKLCGLMVGAVGKSVAVAGEGSLNDAYDWVFTFRPDKGTTEAEQRAVSDRAQAAEIATSTALYRTGERVQAAAATAVAKASNPDVNLERWRRTAPGAPCECGHVPSVHEQGPVCTGEKYNREPCKGGPCNGYVPAEPTGGWVHVDRRPDGLKYAAVRAVEADPFAGPVAPKVDPAARVAPAATRAAVPRPPRACCYIEVGRCATCRNGGPAGRCCFPLRGVCPLHH